MKTRFAAAALIAIGLTGCGKFLDKFSRNSQGFTEVKLIPDRSGARSGLLGSNGSHVGLLDVLQGGAIVYAVNSITGKVYSAAAASETAGVSLMLPNGPYNFYGVGWEETMLTSTPGSTNRLRCGGGGSRTLTGNGETVNINLATLDECYTNPFFAPSFARTSSPWNTLMDVKFVFCANGTNQSGFSVGSYCQNYLASSYFYKGDGSDKMDRAAYFASSNLMIFSASHDPGGDPPAKPYELYQFDLGTGKQKKIGLEFAGTTPHGARKLKVIPNRQKLAFVRDDGTGTPDELWIYNLGNGSFTRISHATPLASSTGVREFRVSDGGDYIVFASEQDTLGVVELYSVPIGASDTYSAPTKINGAIAGGAPGIKECGGCTGEERFFFQISPGTTNNYVVYSAIQALASRYDLHIASMNGANFPGGTIHGSGPAPVPSGTKISNTEISVANDYIDHVAFSHDGAHILYHAQVATGPVDKIMQIDVSHVAGTSLTVPVPTVLAASGATAPYFQTSKTTQRAIFFTNDGSNALVNTVDMSNPGSTNFVAFGMAAAPPGAVQYASMFANDTKVVAAFRGTPSYAVELRSGNINISSPYDGGGAPAGTSVSHTGGALAGGRQIRPVNANGGGGGKTFLVSSDGTKVYFIADQGTVGVYKAHYGTIGTAGSTEISGAGVAAGANSVVSIALSATDIPFFAAPIDTAPKVELYRTQLAASPTVTRMNSHLQVDSIVSISGSSDNEIPGFPDRIVLDANPLNAVAVTEAWLYNPSSTEYQRMSTLGGDGFGAGRFKVRMLKSASGGAEYATAHESDCHKLSGGQQDGQQITTSVRIPIGDGSPSSPFAVAVDVYPLAISCSGPPETFIFPHGPGTACTASSTHCMVGSGPSSLVLFLNDK